VKTEAMNKQVGAAIRTCGSGAAESEPVGPMGMAKLNGNLYEWSN
jgi:hypothetical protein